MENENRKYKVVFLDVIETLLDLNPIKESLSILLGNRRDLADKWFDQMLFYSLVDSLIDSYHTFGEIAGATLRMVAKANDIRLTDGQIEAFLSIVNDLKPFDDVIPGLAL
ncbi:MAG: hypothetical protein ACRCSQ_02270, partial [Bacteroidales bacterium]